MAKHEIQITKTAGNADVPGRLGALDASQRTAVLATDGGGQPYTSLVAFALTKDTSGLVFATPKATTKYRNIRSNPRVSLLIDNRTNAAKDVTWAEAVTVIGTAKPLRQSRRRAELSALLKAKHPELAAFIDADTTTLVLVEISRAVHVGGFQVVSVWEPEAVK